jgi:divalent metal cation (Fe/Co/Zn/Cd) transporter
LSFLEGLEHLSRATTVRNPLWSYLVLGASMVFEGISFRVSLREFRKKKTKSAGSLLKDIRVSKDPSLFVVLLEDSAALMGLTFALLGVSLSFLTGNPVFDACASLLISLLLTSVALFLGNECRNLLIGESLTPEQVLSVRRLVKEEDPGIQVSEVLSMYLGPDEVLLNLCLHFGPCYSGEEQLAALKRIEEAIRMAHPEINRIFVDVNALGGECEGAEAG